MKRPTYLTPVVVFQIALLTACGDYSIKLPNGYELTRISGSKYVISNSEKLILLGASVDKYYISGAYVIGSVSHSDDAPGTRFFTLDTERNRVIGDLPKHLWQKELTKIGVQGELKLKRPNRFQSMK